MDFDRLQQELGKWWAKGDRCVEIKLRRGDKSWTVWIFDYSIESGIFLTANNYDENWDKLLLIQKRRELAEKQKQIDKRLMEVG